MQKVPFKYGEIVTGEYFTNRESEIKRLHNNFYSLQNTIIISPRRYGKSSLIKEACNCFNEKDYVICNMDLMGTYNQEMFFNKFATAVIQSTSSKLEDFTRAIKKLFSSAKLSFNPGIEGGPTIELGLSFIEQNTEYLINIAQHIGETKKKKIIFCIDEFQNISKFKESENLQGMLRASWQGHNNVCYVLYGSKKTMMSEIFQKQNMPFYKFGDTIPLKKIEFNKLSDYIQNAFVRTNKKINTSLIKRIIDFSENHPFYVQQLAGIVWQLADNEVDENILGEAEKIIVADNLNYATEIIDNLTSYQSNFLRAILNGEKQLYSSAVINRYNLGSSPNVKRLHLTLQSKDIITKEEGSIFIIDPIFKKIAKKQLF